MARLVEAVPGELVFHHCLGSGLGILDVEVEKPQIEVVCLGRGPENRAADGWNASKRGLNSRANR
ncbi:MAG: hypothetical protein A4E57_04323 [Syntrophorhabdaceae bacterium PtaU1.Bin034]|nr:MAG: hypothetical protein A4E57_04323 [Syntrophorhabdaceae bacterium PtaU1.Bin034]